MSKSKAKYKTTAKSASTTAKVQKVEKKAKKEFQLSPKVVKLTLFVLLAVFCTFVYGDVFARAEQEGFVNFDRTTMKFLLDKPLGEVYWLGRVMLLVFKSKWIGGIVLAALLTGTACQLDYIFRLSRTKLCGVSFLLPVAELAYLVSLGTNLYYKEEPSRTMLYPVAIFLFLLLCRVVVQIIRHRKHAEAVSVEAKNLRVFPYGFAISLAAIGVLFGYAYGARQNTILEARMQNRLWDQDWEGMVEDGLSARRPTRAVAAYYAMGLLQRGELMERLFEIPYDYPINGGLNYHDGAEEYGLLQADADFEAGLVQVAYHYCMEFIVMNGPSLPKLKRMAICSIMMGEKEAARKYLRIIGSMPFEGAFVEKYSPMVDNPELIDSDLELANVKKLWPRENKFEQQYRQPAFLGYNLGLMEGSNETLMTSIAACLYSKDLISLMPRVGALVQKRMNMPVTVQQALVCLSLKDKGAHKEVLSALPNPQFAQRQVEAFLMDSKPYIKDKDALRDELKDKWIGTYMYYYYCMNNDSIATGKKSAADWKGVN